MADGAVEPIGPQTLHARPGMAKMGHLWPPTRFPIVQPVDARPSGKPSLYSRVFFRFIDWLRQRIAQASLVGTGPSSETTSSPGWPRWRPRRRPSAMN